MRRKGGDGGHRRPQDADGVRSNDGRPLHRDEPALSVVVVTKNEASRIDDCLDSIFEACIDGPRFEVILVDSNSTDNTVDIALDYPVTIYQLPKEAPITPAAGRFVGTHAARGERLLFVDGDMVLNEVWLPQALNALEDPEIAGVDGHLNDIGDQTEPQAVDAIRGVALYDTPALKRVGGFDPFLRSVEDIDLGYRLRREGYRLQRLPVVAAEHPEPPGLHEPLRRWRNGYPFGPGQIIRKTLTRPRLLVKHLLRLRYKLIAGGWLMIGAVSVLSWPLFAGWMTISTLASGVLIKRRGLRWVVRYALSTGLGLAGLIPGFVRPIKHPDSFPLHAVKSVREEPAGHSPHRVAGNGRNLFPRR